MFSSINNIKGEQLMNELCEYGCGKQAIKKLKNGKYCCSQYTAQCSHVRELNSVKQKQLHKDGLKYNFTDEGRVKSNAKALKEALEKAFVKNSTYSNEFIKPKFIEHYAIEYKCNDCGITEWNNKKIVLELDHIDGDNRNNEPSNLRLLCPNCHSQTDNFRGRNINSGFVKVSDEILLEAIKSTKNTRLALIKVGLSPKGGNYSRVATLKEKHSI